MELSKDIKARLILELYEQGGRVDDDAVRDAERGYRDYQMDYFDEWYRDRPDAGRAYAAGQRIGRIYDIHVLKPVV